MEDTYRAIYQTSDGGNGGKKTYECLVTDFSTAFNNVVDAIGNSGYELITMREYNALTDPRKKAYLISISIIVTNDV